MTSFDSEPVIPSSWDIAEISLRARGTDPTFLKTAVETARLLLNPDLLSVSSVEQPLLPHEDPVSAIE